MVAQLLRRSVAHFAIQRAQHEEGRERLRVNTARRAQPPETAIPTHPSYRLAHALHPFVRPRPARSLPRPLAFLADTILVDVVLAVVVCLSQ